MTKPAIRRLAPTRIREWRLHRKMTQEALAHAVGITTSHVSMLETGKRPYSQEILERIAKVLKTDPASLLSRAPTETEPIWRMWDDAAPAQRQQIEEVVRALIRTGTR